NWAPRSFRKAVSEWNYHVGTAHRAGMRVGTKLYTEVRYEDLSRNPHSTLERLLRFLGREIRPTELELAVKSNTFEVSRAGGGTAIPLKGEVRKTAGAVLHFLDGFYRRGTVGTWRQDIGLLRGALVWFLTT